MKRQNKAVDMTSGPVIRELVLFGIPLLLGNLFQQMYNTVDSLVVGNYVSTEALAAVGSTTSIVGTLVRFFNGVSIGAGVVISHNFGARDSRGLHRAVQTTIGLTLILSAVFTLIGYTSVPWTLRMMRMPEDVLDDATLYLHIYYAGISGLLLYNMGAAIMRAVGDTRRPLYFLIFSSLLNIVLDLFFVLVLHRAIDGVAYATILAQGISAAAILYVLTRSDQPYGIRWRELMLDHRVIGEIVRLGLPTGLQQSITALSNVFVQGYINFFGTTGMAGWSIYTKMDQFIFLPLQSMAQAATTFVGQNTGAGQNPRSRYGIRRAMLLSLLVTLPLVTGVWLGAPAMSSWFNKEPEVIEAGTMILRTNVPIMMFCCVNQVLAGGLRGFGNARSPMLIFLLGQVVIRQIYLYVIARYVRSLRLVVFGFPVGWMITALMMSGYYLYYVRRQQRTEKPTAEPV